MGFNMLFSLVRHIPKWLIIASIAVIFAYFSGISQGHAPYKLAQKLSVVRVQSSVKQLQISNRLLVSKKDKAVEIFADYNCFIDDIGANGLSNIQAN